MTASRFPEWMTKKKIRVEKVHQIKALLRDLQIKTICESTKCPNIGECFSKPIVTFMILGDLCSRNCSFCSIYKGDPKHVDFGEPDKIAKAAKQMALKHTIITSVCRDDLADSGALHFNHTVSTIKNMIPETTIEVLVPDFNGNTKAIRTVINSNPNIFNHNIATVPRLYSQFRSKADYEKSLKVLKTAKRIKHDIMTKSGLMVGLGETEDEVCKVMDDLKEVKCDIVTIGQYVQPTPHNIHVSAFITPELFMRYKEYGTKLGFAHIESAPFVRSSYNAELFMIDSLKNEKQGNINNGSVPTYKEAAPLRI